MTLNHAPAAQLLPGHFALGHLLVRPRQPRITLCQWYREVVRSSRGLPGRVQAAATRPVIIATIGHEEEVDVRVPRIIQVALSLREPVAPVPNGHFLEVAHVHRGRLLGHAWRLVRAWKQDRVEVLASLLRFLTDEGVELLEC